MEQNIFQTGGKAIIAGGMAGEALTAMYDLRWMVAFIFSLVVADFWFGVKASLARKEKFRFSRAGRRTCNKFCDYIVYLIVGALFGMAIFEPLGICSHTTAAAVCLGLGCLWEIDSIMEHVCTLHGIKKKFSIKRLLIALLKAKHQEVGEAVEEAIGKMDGGSGSSGETGIK